MTYAKKWLIAAGIRALRTFAQTAASLVTVGSIISDIEWKVVFSTAAVAAIYSMLTSIAGLPEIKQPEDNAGSGEDEIEEVKE